MKISLVHDCLKYQAKERTRFAGIWGRPQDRNDDQSPHRLICVEGTDERLSDWVEGAKGKVAGKLGVKNIALLPFAHLSPDLASSTFANKVLSDLESRVKEVAIQF